MNRGGHSRSPLATWLLFGVLGQQETADTHHTCLLLVSDPILVTDMRHRRSPLQTRIVTRIPAANSPNPTGVRMNGWKRSSIIVVLGGTIKPRITRLVG